MNDVGSLKKQKQEQKLKYKHKMIELKCRLTNTPGKVLLSKPYNNTSRRESKIRAVTEGSDVSNSGYTLHCSAIALTAYAKYNPTPKLLMLLTIRF